MNRKVVLLVLVLVLMVLLLGCAMGQRAPKGPTNFVTATPAPHHMTDLSFLPPIRLYCENDELKVDINGLEEIYIETTTLSAIEGDVGKSISQVRHCLDKDQLEKQLKSIRTSTSCPMCGYPSGDLKGLTHFTCEACGNGFDIGSVQETKDELDPRKIKDMSNLISSPFQT